MSLFAVRESHSSSNSNTKPVRVCDVATLGYAAHGAALLGVKAKAGVKYKLAQKLVHEHQLQYFETPATELSVADQYDGNLNTKAAFGIREKTKKHPKCKEVLRGWWRALAGDQEQIDKKTYFDVGCEMIHQVFHLLNEIIGRCSLR